jgi:hypothetical protein
MASAAPVTVLAALSLSAAACGGGESTADRTARAPTIAEAVDETLAAGTAMFTLTLEHTRDDPTLGAGEGERESFAGVVDFDARRTASGESDRVIVDETAFYLQPGAEGDLRWLRYDLAPASGGKPAPDVTLGRLDVVRQLEYADSIAGSLEPAGKDDVRGAATTRYTGHGEAEALMRALLPESVYAELPWSTHAVTVDRAQPVPFDVWVGEDGRVHKLTYDFPDFSSYVGDLTTIELYDFGADVDIELPTETIDG